jgi:nitronate monooxygenase
MNFANSDSKVKAWRDIWSAGQGVGAVKQVVGVAEFVARLESEYQAALTRITTSQPALARRAPASA